MGTINYMRARIFLIREDVKRSIDDIWKDAVREIKDEALRKQVYALYKEELQDKFLFID